MGNGKITSIGAGNLFYFVEYNVWCSRDGFLGSLGSLVWSVSKLLQKYLWSVLIQKFIFTANPVGLTCKQSWQVVPILNLKVSLRHRGGCVSRADVVCACHTVNTYSY